VCNDASGSACCLFYATANAVGGAGCCRYEGGSAPTDANGNDRSLQCVALLNYNR